MKMSQEFHVLCCYSCETYQVHQVKKSSKWQCKLCGAKQSVKMVFVLGNAVDCRKYVQNMNLLIGQTREQSLTTGNEVAFHTECHQQTSSSSTNSNLNNLESMWTMFLDDTKADFKDISKSKEEMTGLQSTSLKRKSDDSLSAKSNKSNLKKGKNDILAEEDGSQFLTELGFMGKPKSLKRDDEKTPASISKLPNTFAHKSKDLPSNEASQNEQSLDSSSKWHKFIENS